MRRDSLSSIGARRPFALLLAACFVASGLPAFADALPTPAELEAHIAAATGTALPASREIVDTTQGGGVDRSVTVTAGKDYREDEGDGPVHEAYGTYRGQKWRQDANGQTILMQPDPGNEAPDPKVATVARIATPVDGYLLSSLDAHGFGTKRYVEAASWHVVREDEIRPSRTQITTYDDFRTVAGFTEAFHSKSSDGHPENDTESRVVDLKPAIVTPADVAIPGSRRILVQFPAGKSVVVLPAHEVDGQFIVRVQVGARGLDFLLDSGASGILMQDGVAKQLGLSEYGSYSNGSNAGRFHTSLAVVPQMTVGDLTMKDVAIATVPNLPGEDDIAGTKVVGLLGFDFIADIVLKLDYQAGVATAYDPDTFVPPAETDGFDVDVRVGGGTPDVTVAVNGAPGDRFTIDTGAYGGVMMFDYYTRRNRAALVDEGGGGDMRDVRIIGVGGEIDTKPYQLKSVRLGNVDFRDFVAYAVSERKQYDSDDDGLIGQLFLRAFDVYFDYVHSKVYFIANALGRSAEQKVRSPKPPPKL
jgi:hypothetical protein